MHLPAGLLRVGLRMSRPIFASARLSVATKRKAVDALAGAARPPRGMSVRSRSIAGVPVDLVEVPGSGETTLLYLHGGGYALGSAAGYRGVVARFAEAGRMRAVVPEYSRSPEARFPAALDEMVEVYRALVADPARGRVVVAGDSAGGGLALALAMRVRDLGLVAPAAVGLICPWLDLVADTTRTRVARRDPLIVPEMLTGWVTAYTGGATPPSDPFVSPLYGDLRNLPPVVVHSAGDDPIAADSEALEDAFGRLGISAGITHRSWPWRWHCFHLQAGMFRDADQAVADMGERLAVAALNPVAGGQPS